MVVKGEKMVFPGGGTRFHHGADKYMANVLNFPKNVINNKGGSPFLMSVVVLLVLGVIFYHPMSLLCRWHQNQILFALERGIPAYLGVLGTKRLPYPSRSFELAHCSRCRIDWLQRDGILLLEFDRLLRPGGYFAYSSPEAYAQDEEDLRIWKEMGTLLERMCWKIASKKNQTVIWVKPLNNDCYTQRPPGTQPPLCRSDAVSGLNMEACISTYSDRVKPSLPILRLMIYLLHARNIIYEIEIENEKKGCSPEDLLLEIDRILRQSGVDFVKK